MQPMLERREKCQWVDWQGLSISAVQKGHLLPEIILDMGSANERWSYTATSSPIGWDHIRNVRCALLTTDTLFCRFNISLLWDQIKYPFLDFNSAFEVCKWIDIFITSFTRNVNTYPYYDLNQSVLIEGPAVSQSTSKVKNFITPHTLSRGSQFLPVFIDKPRPRPDIFLLRCNVQRILKGYKQNKNKLF